MVIIKALKHGLIGLLLYTATLFFVILNPVQRSILYLHWINIPSPIYLKKPHTLGLPISQVRDFQIASSDGIELGAWHILPYTIYQKEKESLKSKGLILEDSFGDEFYIQQLKDSTNDIVLYFHGNAANRGDKIRYPTYDAFSHNLNSHVIIIDYRGFGDSSGTPSENGLYEDSLATWDWLSGLSIDPKRVSICGHSLGTGVSLRLVSLLNEKQIFPKSLILTASYNSILDALFDYKVFFIPIFFPLKSIPNHRNHVSRFLKHRFESFKYLPNVSTPVLFFHGKKDNIINTENSWLLFNSTLGKNSQGGIYPPTTTNIIPGVGHQVTYIAKNPDGSNVPNKISSIVIMDQASHNDIPEFPIFSEVISDFWALINVS